MAFSPLNASRELYDSYMRYLSTIFSVDDPDYQAQFQAALKDRSLFAKGPYLDVSDAFRTGDSITQLIEKGKLPKNFSLLKVPQQRPLYQHQIAALDMVSSGKNMIVSTGTGSGKTESFLYPILKSLLDEKEAGTLGPGTRAMLIYPMNALANDQVERLRTILADCPEITFGAFTGQTRESYEQALQEYQDLNDGRIPCENELISREQMRAAPPNLLITNYAMLEYLLIRPNDSVFFSKENTKHWKFVVLDEAHVYHGSTGIEVSMLLRRLKARLENYDMQFILTSATLGGENDNDTVAQFGRNLCDSPFAKDQVIRADRISFAPPADLISLGEDFYHTISQRLQSSEPEDSILAYLQEHFSVAEKNLDSALFFLLQKDRFFWTVRNFLDQPRTVNDILSAVGCSEQTLSDFVNTATRAVWDGTKLFDARYHMFLRATDSAYITLAPSKKLFLTKREKYFEDDQSYAVFEIAVCSHCHGIYLLGQEVNGYLIQQSNYADFTQRSAFLLGRTSDETDDENTMEELGEKVEPYEICACCGSLNHAGSAYKCEHAPRFHIPVSKVTLSNPEAGLLTKCPRCENVNTSGILRKFFSGQEAVTSMLGTTLFQCLPDQAASPAVPQKPSLEKTDEDSFIAALFEDSEDRHASEVVTGTSLTNSARQFIAFSDNRQQAAFYATYLDQTYCKILYRRILVEALARPAYDSREYSLEEFAKDVESLMGHYHIVSYGSRAAAKEAWKALLYEAIDNTSDKSLTSMGLLTLSVSPENLSALPKLGLTKEDVRTICTLFVYSMMAEGAVSCPEMMNEEDKSFYLYNGIECSYMENTSDAKKHLKSFLPARTTGMTNRRMDYLDRLLQKKGIGFPREMLEKLLKAFWTHFLTSSQKGGENSILSRVDSKDPIYRVNTANLRVSRAKALYICPKCHKITAFNLENVCPTYRCDGQLVPFKVSDAYRENHYYNLYHSLNIRPLRVVEHTAQLDRDTAYDYQKKFKQKELDVLSCSTTFEMGVDVGSLETVFMRNMPPSPANYAQRAGRAGRSLHSAAFALTFCNRSSHDFSFFRFPEQMIRGKIDPPLFNIENEKIAIRHLYASVLGLFWRRYPQYFGNTKTFLEGFENAADGENAITQLSQFLAEKPAFIKDYLVHFLPKNLQKKFQLDTFGWVPRLLNTDTEKGLPFGALNHANADYHYNVDPLRADYTERIASGKPADSLVRRVQTFERESILTFLSRENVLPKYGFPVDTVSLYISNSQKQKKQHEVSKIGLELQRDLSIAISEYAPGSQIVANGKLITSRYIRKMPSLDWPMSRYNKCPFCHSLNLRPYLEEDDFTYSVCDTCGHPLNGKGEVYLIPEFGFVADADSIRAATIKKPARTYRGEVSYIPKEDTPQFEIFHIGHADIQVSMSENTELAVLNESHFFVCGSCGYTEMDAKDFKRVKQLRKNHRTPSGHLCPNKRLQRYSLAYRFQTDAVQIQFADRDISDYEQALSILYGILEGARRALNIEQTDIAGCIHWYSNAMSHGGNYGFILYDSTPGGAGHVKRLQDASTLEFVLKETLNIMENCTCGSDDMETSCYGCLRNYYNQRYHDLLKRGYVVRFLRDLFYGEPAWDIQQLLARAAEESKQSESGLGENIPSVSQKSASEAACSAKKENSLAPAWQKILEELDDTPEYRAFVQALSAADTPLPDDLGCDLTDETGRVICEAEMVWRNPTGDIAVLSEENKANQLSLIRSGYQPIVMHTNAIPVLLHFLEET